MGVAVNRPALSLTLHFGFRLGRRSNSPPQFGHTPCIASVQDLQKVHSKLQICASRSGGSPALHFSQTGRISRLIGTSMDRRAQVYMDSRNNHRTE
jgi:hypothetical protein